MDDGNQPGAEVIALEQARQGRASAVVYRVGGREYPLRSAPDCTVCLSPSRVEIEESLLKGHSYASIARGIGDGQTILARHIGIHVRSRHLPMDLVVRRAIMEERATQIGKSIEDAETAIIDHIGFARLGLQRVVERMANGEIKPSMQDGIEFAKILIKLDEITGGDTGIDQQVIYRGFLSYMQAIRSVCTDEQVKEIGKLLSSNPVMKGLQQRAEADNTIEVPVDA